MTNNHIVPQFYLKYFCNYDNNISVYDIIHENFVFKSTKSICYQKNTYSTDLEKKFSILEDEVAKVYPQIIQKLESNKISYITKKEEHLLLKFIIIQYYRTNLGRCDLYGQYMDEIINYKNIRINAEQANDILLNKSFDFIVQSYLEDKLDYDISIYKSNENIFWTFPNPVMVGNNHNLFIKSYMDESKKYNSLFFTLSPKLCAIINFNKTNKYNHIEIYNLSKNNQDKDKYALYTSLLSNLEFLSTSSNIKSIKDSHLYIFSKRFNEMDKRFLKSIKICEFE